jgi:hypothetical protein
VDVDQFYSRSPDITMSLNSCAAERSSFELLCRRRSGLAARERDSDESITLAMGGARLSPGLVVLFERTAYRRFIAASWALRSFANTRGGDNQEAGCAYFRTLVARAAHEERRYRRWHQWQLAHPESRGLRN